MADKYIIHGAAFNGDGTSSAEATADGGVGAWNTINILTGTTPSYGTLAAGDVVYIRSKTSAGADISIPYSTVLTIGSTTATAANWIDWILDDGTIWPGVDGLLTFTTGVNAQLAGRANNSFTSLKKNSFRLVNTATVPDNWTALTVNNYAIRNWYVQTNAGTSGGGSDIVLNGRAILENCSIVGRNRMILFRALFSGAGNISLVNCDVEMRQVGSLFGNVEDWPYIELIGGRLYGAGATTGANILLGPVKGSLNLVGFQYPKTVNYVSGFGTLGHVPSAVMLNDGGAAGGMIARWGTLDSRNDNNYPTLNATLPNSVNSAWSWRLYPATADRVSTASHTIAKMYQANAATATITLELQVSDSFTGLHRENVWMDVSYIDQGTGLPVGLTTRTTRRDEAPLTPSTAVWSATTWGAISMLKRKLEVTTPTAIKKDTPVVVTFRCAKASGSANDVIFICPDVQLS